MSRTNEITKCPLFDGFLHVDDIRPGAKVWGSHSEWLSTVTPDVMLLFGWVASADVVEGSKAKHQRFMTPVVTLNTDEPRLWFISVSNLPQDQEMNIKWHYHRE